MGSTTKSKKRGMKRFSGSQGLLVPVRGPSGHLANPKDVEKAALNNPDLTFCHLFTPRSSMAPMKPEFKDPKFIDPVNGDMTWHKRADGHQETESEDDERLFRRSESFFQCPCCSRNSDSLRDGTASARNIKHYGADHVILGEPIASGGALRNGRLKRSSASRSPTKCVTKFGLQEDLEGRQGGASSD